MAASRLRLVTRDDRPGAVGPLAFDDVFRTYARYIGSIGLRALGRPHEVEDFVQDVFLRAHRGLASVKEPAAIKSWLVSIAVRLAMRRLRRRRLTRFIGADVDFDYESAVDPAITPEDRAIFAQMYRRLDQLPAAHRLAWTLRHLEGERLEQVAELCGCSLATAKRWIQAAQVALAGRTG